MTTKITLQIPKELKQKLDEIIKETNFKSIQEYLLFFLEQLISEKGEGNQAYTKEEESGIRGNFRWDKEDTNKKGYSEKEEADLKKTLEDMGYI